MARMCSASTHVSTFLAVAVILAAAGAAAQNETDTSLDIQNYRPAPSPGNYFGIQGSDVTPHLQMGFALEANYQHEPLLFIPAGGGEDDQIEAVSHQTTLDFLCSVGLFDILQIAMAMPVVVAQEGEGIAAIPGAQGERLSMTAIRDLRLQLKGRILGKSKGGAPTGFGLALAFGMSAPTGDDDNFAGDANVTADAPVIIADWRNDFVKASFNVGLRWRETSAVGANFRLGHQLLYGAGVAVMPLRQRLIVLGEFEGMLGFEKLDQTEDRLPMEARLGIGVALDKNKDLTLVVGGGVGLGGAPTVPLLRIIGSLRYAPQNRDQDGDAILDREDKCLNEKEDHDQFEDDDGCPEADNDKDGIDDLVDDCPNEAEDEDEFEDEDGCSERDNDEDGIDDQTDSCPSEVEDVDQFEDDDGCPEVDNDEDGVPDHSDTCLMEAEDRDGFGDSDGCPETDNDGDDLPDEIDSCRDHAEDKDGFQDEDGCPDLDNDVDGIPDTADMCPDKTETLNGVKDEDGCPDKGTPLVIITKDQIKITQKIIFKKDSDLIEGKTSFKILDVVANVLRLSPQIKVEIQCHTDATGTRERNLELSQGRADSVMKYLLDKGIDPTRLTAKGYGPDVPIADNATAKGREANRRVEFWIR